MTLNELIGANIKNTRCSLNIKAEILAQEIGVSKATFSLIENGKVEITVERLLLIATKLNVPITSLLPPYSTNTNISTNQSTQNPVNEMQNMDESTYKTILQMANQLKNLLNQK